MGANLQLAVKVVAALFVILVATTLCGRLALRIGQPRVIGEMVAGVLLGPSMLGLVAPGIQHHIFPADVNSVLYVLSTIGLTFYMFLTGAGIDHRFIEASAVRKSVILAVSGVVPPFALGVGAAFVFYRKLATPGTSMLVFALFLGGALAITAFPVLARVIQDRGMANTRLGAMLLMIAAVDDAAAWAILAVIIALSSASGASGAVVTIVGAALFAALMLTVGRKLLRRLADRVERDGVLSHGVMGVVLLVVLGAGWFTDLIGIFSVFGGFVTGLAIPHSPVFRRQLQQRLMDLNSILLVPVFFAYSGLNTRLSGLADLGLLVPFLVIVVLAFAGKYVSSTLSARWLGMPWRHASAIGGMMIARGLMILVFINIGLAYHVITPTLYSMMVIVAVVSSAAAVPIYRASLGRDGEQAQKNEGAQPLVPVVTTDDGQRRMAA